MNAAELNVQLMEAASIVRASQDDLEQRVKDYAQAERQYRLAKATAYLSTSGTVAEREAHAETAINELRYKRDLSEGLKLSALEAVRSNRGLVSAIQTLARLYEQEAAFDRTGPGQEQPSWGKPGEGHGMSDDTLFDLDDTFKPWQRRAETLVRMEDPETSHVAARTLSGKAGTMRRTLLVAFSGEDLTSEEVSEQCGYTPADGAWKRVSDLQNAKLIEPTGHSRTASTGRQQRVMRITAFGREALR